MKTWADRIRELEASGLTLKQIAEAIELSVSSVSDLKQGSSKEPRGMAAVKLHELHRDRLGQSDAA